MAPRPRPIYDRIADKTRIADNHHFWQGKMHKGRPAIKVDGVQVNPLRILLDIQHLQLKDRKLLAIRKLPELCLHERCINPDHHEVQIKTDHFRDDYRPDWKDPRMLAQFTVHDLGDIEYGLELLSDGHDFSYEEFENIPERLIDEIKRRHNHRGA